MFRMFLCSILTHHKTLCALLAISDMFEMKHYSLLWDGSSTCQPPGQNPGLILLPKTGKPAPRGGIQAQSCSQRSLANTHTLSGCKPRSTPLHTQTSHKSVNGKFPESQYTWFIFIIASKTQVMQLHFIPNTNLIAEITEDMLLTCEPWETYQHFLLFLITEVMNAH